ncbi:MAG: alpha/beta fold hydrolase [Desulfobacteraceae bacterium]|nr:MAG: alpha/beta fold hydrolase [Desulfobacteraceae bacterium]
MTAIKEWSIQSKGGAARYVREWPHANAAWMALLSHGYGEHIGRYDHVADALREAGAHVVGADHQGHGRSEGEPVLIEDFELVTEDLHVLAQAASEKQAGLPVVLIGHSMGGMIAARYAQRYGRELTALVLSGPMFGAREVLEQLQGMDPIPEIPLDPGLLSRDPSVGKAYASDPLVWHGPFKRPTLQAMTAAMDATAAGPSLGGLPTLWIHGQDDLLVPLEATRPMMAHLRGGRFEEKIYAGAMHEVFNETNRDEVIADVIGFIRRFTAISSNTH